MLGYGISVTVGLCSVMSFQKMAAFIPVLSNEISKTEAVGFVSSQDFTDGQLC